MNEELYEGLYEFGCTAFVYGAIVAFTVGVGSVTIHACNSMGIGPTSRLENKLVTIEQRISSLEKKIQHPIHEQDLQVQDEDVPAERRILVEAYRSFLTLFEIY